MTQTPRKAIIDTINSAMLYDGDLDGKARDVLTIHDTIMDALDAAGFIVVPKEPTDRMVAVGSEKMVCGPACCLTGVDREAEGVWRAMVAASEA